jgi:hypothetical protein
MDFVYLINERELLNDKFIMILHLQFVVLESPTELGI